MGKAIELVPGKSEQYLLLSFEPDSRLWLRGDDSQSMAYIDAAIFGNEGHYGYHNVFFMQEFCTKNVYALILQ